MQIIELKKLLQFSGYGLNRVMNDALIFFLLTLLFKYADDLKIFRDLSARVNKGTIATIGIFDGVHKAHQQIIYRLTELAKEYKTESTLVTLWPHPRYVLGKDAENLKLITTLEEKLQNLERAGLNNLLIIPFDQKFAGLSFHQFIKRILIDKLAVKYLVVGYNHHFGRDRQGNFSGLKEHAEKYGFGLEQMPEIKVDGFAVSSSVIRKNILEGNVELAGKMLGDVFSIKGRVVHGNKIGRELGFPTANIEVPEIYKIIPGDGVYAVEAIVKGQKLNGMLNIGTRPTVDRRGIKVIEGNFFNFNADIYGEEIAINFCKKIREERVFQSTEQLIGQINNDKFEIENYFNNKYN